mmetsp:Transcript_52089/g.110710  ORF Transcript_52089/g.110710 Transcript_52089/m.110710 type:complete len:86 (+) Transcript_52089:1741-1998(+)
MLGYPMVREDGGWLGGMMGSPISSLTRAASARFIFSGNKVAGINFQPKLIRPEDMHKSELYSRGQIICLLCNETGTAVPPPSAEL